MKKIQFNLDDIKEFIDSTEDREYTRCGEEITIQYRLTKDGVIQTRKWRIMRMMDEEWEDTDYKGEIIDEE